MVSYGPAGKTALLHRYVRDEWNPSPTSSVGATQYSKDVTVDSHTVKLNLWDVSGLKRFQSLGLSYMRGCDLLVVCYGVSKDWQSSFEEAEVCLDDMREQVGVTDLPVFFVATMCDLEGEARVVKKDQGEALSGKVAAAGYFETSAQTGEGIDELFVAAAKKCIKQAVAKHGAGFWSQPEDQGVIRLMPPEPPSQQGCFG